MDIENLLKLACIDLCERKLLAPPIKGRVLAAPVAIDIDRHKVCSKEEYIIELHLVELFKKMSIIFVISLRYLNQLNTLWLIFLFQKFQLYIYISN